MVRGRDADEIKEAGDILLRASRPQRNSSFIPTRRDWRYATGVLQHEDLEDTPKEATVWDKLDYDAQIGVFGRERRKVGNGGVRKNGKGGLVRMDSGYTEMESGDMSRSETNMASSVGPETSKSMGKFSPQKNKFEARSRAHTVAFFNRIEETSGDGDEVLEQTRLIICLKFTAENAHKVQRLVGELSLTPASTSTPRGASVSTNMSEILNGVLTPNTPATALSPSSTASPYILTSVGSPRPMPLFERAWVDETKNFNMKEVVASIRGADKVVDDVPASFNWFPEAVPVDAIFPPGVALSAKEMSAYYPHQARWKGVMLRLVNNDYRGQDIVGMQAWFRGLTDPPISAANMNNWLRDALKRKLPGFKTSDPNWKGKPDRNLHTDHLRPGQYISNIRPGFTVPTFDDLLRGLKYLPTGLDARDLTVCLTWYLNFRDMFSPRLEFSVLHTQSLVRALRHPLKGYGPQNLDMNALKEWKETGKFTERRVEEEVRRYKGRVREAEELRKSRLEINPDDHSVKLHLKLPTRDVLVFPFIAMLSMAGKALELGIENAEARKAARLERENDAVDNDQVVQDEEVQSPVEEETTENKQPEGVFEALKGYRIPKRARVEEKDTQEPLAKRHTNIPAGPRVPPLPSQPPPSVPDGPVVGDWAYRPERTHPDSQVHSHESYHPRAPSRPGFSLQPYEPYHPRESAYRRGHRYPHHSSYSHSYHRSYPYPYSSHDYEYNR